MLVMFLLFYALILPCMGFQQAFKVQDLGSDLTSIGLPTSKVRITEAMQSIISTMDKVEKLPSCQKLASQALLNTCSEIDHATSLATDKGVDVMLERSKSIYATRLAICELMDANADIPPSCSLFRPVEHASKANGFRGFVVHGRFTKPKKPHNFDDGRDLDQCSLSLSSNPVWWTSYSNARQNAVLLCHSMRAELEKDDLVQKMKLMFEAVMEAANAMSDTNEEHRAFEKQWTEMGQGMKAFHLAVNSDLEMQKQIIEQWASFQMNMHDLDNNIQHLGRDVERVRETSSHLNSDLENHRLRAQAVQADVTQHLDQVLDVAIKIDQSQDNSLAVSMALDRQNKELVNSLADNVETAKALHRQTEVLLDAIFTVTENVTDAAKTVSNFQKDIHSLPSKVVHQVFQASVGSLPFGFLSLVIFSLFWTLCFASLDTWGPFRPRSSAVASLGLGIAFTYLFFATLCISTIPAFSILGIIAFVFAAIFSCKLWYKQQAAWSQSALSNKIDKDAEHQLISSMERLPTLVHPFHETGSPQPTHLTTAIASLSHPHDCKNMIRS